MVLLTLGTGIGCGIIIGDLVFGGEHSYGGESRTHHHRLRENARMCGCGRRGHLEAYASATAVIKRTSECLDAGRPSSLSRRMAGGGADAQAGGRRGRRRRRPLLQIVSETARLHRRRRGQPDAHGRAGRRIPGRGHDLRRPGDASLGRRFLAQVRQDAAPGPARPRREDRRSSSPPSGATPAISAPPAWPGWSTSSKRGVEASRRVAPERRTRSMPFIRSANQ